MILSLEEDGIKVSIELQRETILNENSQFGNDVILSTFQKLIEELEEKQNRIDKSLEYCKKEIDELLESVKTDSKEEVQVKLDALMSRLNEIPTIE